MYYGVLFLLKDITWGTYCLAVIQTVPVGFFYLNQEHVWMLVADFMYTMPMIRTRQSPVCWKEIYGHGNYNVAVLMVKCLWFYIIKTMQPWKYLLKCFKMYYNYWFVDGQNEKSRNIIQSSGECQLLWSCILTSAVTFPNSMAVLSGFNSDAWG